MSFEKSMGFDPYKFKFDGATHLFVKSEEEITQINERMKEESPESDYESYSWYLTDEKIEKLKYKKVNVVNQVSWHGGLPYYLVELKSGANYAVAEFYLQNSFNYMAVDSEGLVLHETFKNIPEKEGTRIERSPIKLAGYDAAYEEYQTFGSGYHSVLFLYEDVGDMSDEKIEELARNLPEADIHDSLSIHRRKKYGVVYISFSFHRISRLPGSERW
jgi:hypothetical protein